MTLTRIALAYRGGRYQAPGQVLVRQRTQQYDRARPWIRTGYRKGWRRGWYRVDLDARDRALSVHGPALPSPLAVMAADLRAASLWRVMRWEYPGDWQVIERYETYGQAQQRADALNRAIPEGERDWQAYRVHSPETGA